MPSILLLVVTHRGAPTDLEAEQCLLRIIDRVVFHKPVLHRRVNAVTRDGKGFAIRADVKHVVVECVRAVEVSRLAQRICRRIAEARDIGGPDGRIAFFAREPGRGENEVLGKWLYGEGVSATRCRRTVRAVSSM